MRFPKAASIKPRLRTVSNYILNKSADIIRMRQLHAFSFVRPLPQLRKKAFAATHGNCQRLMAEPLPSMCAIGDGASRPCRARRRDANVRRTTVSGWRSPDATTKRAGGGSWSSRQARRVTKRRMPELAMASLLQPGERSWPRQTAPSLSRYLQNRTDRE